MRDRVAVGDTEYLLHERRNCVEKRVRGQKSEFLPLPTGQLEWPEPRAVPASETAQPNDEPMNTDDSNPGSGFATPPEHIRNYIAEAATVFADTEGPLRDLVEALKLFEKWM